MSNKLIKKQSHSAIIVFLMATAVIIFLVLAFSSLQQNIRNERSAVEKEVEMQGLSQQLGDASDYLTSEVRKFCVTLDPVHLRNYWTEINKTQTRDKVLKRLKELDTPLNEFDLLNEAKNNSDDLVNTETRAMKLILRVYEVPDEQMEPAVADYQLTMQDENLSFNDKVNLAREILYDANYSKNKQKIAEPIEEFDRIMSARIHDATLSAQHDTDRSRLILLIALILIVLYVIFLTWYLLYRISMPMKSYFLDTSNEDVNETEELKKSKALKIIIEFEAILRKKIRK